MPVYTGNSICSQTLCLITQTSLILPKDLLIYLCSTWLVAFNPFPHLEFETEYGIIASTAEVTEKSFLTSYKVA